MRAVILALAAALPQAVVAQGPATDCALEDLRGPVAEVTITRIPYERDGSGWAEARPRLIRTESYDADCYTTERHIHGSLEVHYTYQDDAEGRGRRFTREEVRNSTASSLPPPPEPEAAPTRTTRRQLYPSDDQPGTLKEVVYFPDSSVVRGRLSRHGYLTEEWFRTLDSEGRLVHDVRYDGRGQRTYEVSYEYSESVPEAVADYDHPVTDFRSVQSAGRWKYVFEASDEEGNWTRRTQYKWNRVSQEWEPQQIYARKISYHEVDPYSATLLK